MPLSKRTCWAVATALAGAFSCSGASWSNYRDPLGFSADLPPGWVARADKESGRVDINGGEAKVTILPVFTRTGMTQKRASAVLARLAASAWPDIQWSAAVPGPSAARMIGRKANVKALAVFAWIPAPTGSAGYFYAMQAPGATYQSHEQAFSRILSSFRIIGRGQSPAGSLTYNRWTDPVENAFNLETPAGWRTEGGLKRLSAVDPRVVWMMTSPDSAVRVMSGDANVPVFTMPNQMLLMSGFREGSWYSPGYGVRMMVRRYTDGAAFAREYVTGRAAQGCTDLSFTDVRGRNDAVSALNRVYVQYGLMTQLSAGEVAFTCRQNANLINGYYFVTTRVTGAQGNGIWNVEHLTGYLAVEGKAELAQQVMSHAIASSRLNPDWVAMQQGLTQSVSQIVTQTQNEISRIITDSYWSRHRNDSEMSRRQSNATLGVVDVVDPETGREFKVESGSNYHWIDARGRIAGTQTDTTPNVDFRQLVTLP